MWNPSIMPLYLVFLVLLHFVSSQSQNEVRERVWSIFSYTIHGDNTPFSLSRPKTLTPLGAQQLFASGSSIRKRYLISSTDFRGTQTRLNGLSPVHIDYDRIQVMSMVDHYVSASAHAFMQGLYPPLQDLSRSALYSDYFSVVNGTTINSPLNGYQYPQILTASPEDPNFVLVAGHVKCPLKSLAESEYKNSENFRTIESETAPFYQRIHSRIFDGVLPAEYVSYSNADHIFEYLNYQYIHNRTIGGLISSDDVLYSRYLADQLISATNADFSARRASDDKSVLSVAGRTLAYHIVRSFTNYVRLNGTENQMTLLFGSSEPIIALSALSRLASPVSKNLYNILNPGASIVFELFSLETDPDKESFSSQDDLMVRFFLRNATNATDADEPLISYPMFGYGPSHTAISYDEFLDEMINIMIPPSTWCRTCNSSISFCSPYMPKNSDEVTKKECEVLASFGIISTTVLGSLGLIACITGLLLRFMKVRGKRCIARNNRLDSSGSGLNTGCAGSSVGQERSITRIVDAYDSWQMEDIPKHPSVNLKYPPGTVKRGSSSDYDYPDSHSDIREQPSEVRGFV